MKRPLVGVNEEKVIPDLYELKPRYYFSVWECSAWLFQGSHASWKTCKINDKFFSHGKYMENQEEWENVLVKVKLSWKIWDD